MVNYGDGFGMASDNSNITELNSSGTLIGTYKVGVDPVAIAIDSHGNVWVANEGKGTVDSPSRDSNITELNSSGTLIGTYKVGTTISRLIAIERSNNNGEYFPYNGPEWP